MFNKSLQVDSGATVHVCKDRCWFKTYESLNDRSILHMGNESKALVHGRGYVDLRFCYVYLLHTKDEALDKFKVFKTEAELQQGSKSKDLGLIGEGQLSMSFEPNDSVSINSIIESRDAIFDENIFSLVPRPSLRILNGTEDIGGSVVPKKVTKEDDPKIFDEAMKSHDVAFWKETINDEMDSIMGNNTWVLADLLSGCKPLGCKWIFKRKLKVDGTIE
ncbi:hypothetical protein Tco_1350191, partial [Tanacetum coccineum]